MAARRLVAFFLDETDRILALERLDLHGQGVELIKEDRVGEERPAVDDQRPVAACACSFIVRRQRGVQIDLDAADQRLDALREIGVQGLQPLGMLGHVAGQEAEEWRERGIVASPAAAA